MTHTFEEGLDGDIANCMSAIEETARRSNGFALEIGVRTGTGSTLAIQRGLASHQNPLHISVDIVDAMWTQPTVSWWHLILGDSRDPHTVDRVIHFCGREDAAGFIFIDTEHTYEQMQAELLVWGRMADEGTVWLFHDVYDNSGMVQAIKEFAALYDWRYDELVKEPQGLGRLTR